MKQEIKSVTIIPDEELYIVDGVGMPLQIIPYTEIGEWNVVKDNKQVCCFDIQIDYDDYFGWQIQYVNLVGVGDDNLRQGNDWHTIKPIVLQ